MINTDPLPIKCTDKKGHHAEKCSVTLMPLHYYAVHTDTHTLTHIHTHTHTHTHIYIYKGSVGSI